MRTKLNLRPCDGAGAHADHSPSFYLTQRTQSRELAAMPWHSRIAPVGSWRREFAVGVLMIVIFVALFEVLS